MVPGRLSAIAVALLFGAITSTVFGGVRLSNTMNAVARINDNGRLVIVTGPLTCIAAPARRSLSESA
jgi:hypothetical protein